MSQPELTTQELVDQLYAQRDAELHALFALLLVDVENPEA